MFVFPRRQFLSSAAPLLVSAGKRPPAALSQPQPQPQSFFVSWGNTTSPDFYRFLDEVKPELVQVGFYGPMFHGYADNPASTGYMMRLPTSGQREALAAQRRVNEQIHQRGLKVMAHFQMINVIQKGGGIENNFAEFWDHHWPEDTLGRRPHSNWRELMQRDGAGNPIARKHYVDYHGLCLNSPFAMQLLRRMLDVALNAGVDGIMTNYNYRWGCVCEHCQRQFRAFLAARHSRAQLNSKFGIRNLSSHHFTTIAGEIPGLPKPDAPPLDWEAMHWAAQNFKQRWDELLIAYGRKRKPDLILGQWNHLGDVNAGEERAFTPVEQFGRGENFFWYSGGYGPTRLAEHKAGDAWLSCLWVREMSGGKPFVMGKYENIRMRNTIAEGVATGGAGMGLQIQFTDPEGFQTASTYLRFVRRHASLYPRQPWAEVGLIYPRQAIWNHHPEAADIFRALGRAMVDSHLLFDVLWDQKITLQKLERYSVIVVPGYQWLSAPQRNLLDAAERKGVPVLHVNHATPELPQLTNQNLSRIDAPWMLRVVGYAGPTSRVLHFVNYNRDEQKAMSLKGPAAECPTPVLNVHVDVALPAKPTALHVFSPDDAATPTKLDWTHNNGRLQFTVPKVFVYSIVDITLK